MPPDAASSACSRAIQGSASCATPTPATPRRSRSQRAMASTAAGRAARGGRRQGRPAPGQEKSWWSGGRQDDAHPLMFRSRKDKQKEAQELRDDVVVIVDRAVNPYLVLFHEPAGFMAEQVRAL